MRDKLSRRQFLRTSALASASAAVSLGFIGCNRALLDNIPGFKPELPYQFTPSANRLLDLPEGFTANAISRTGEMMDDGLWVPGKHDGMAAFPGPNGKTILIRNHELNATDKTLGAFGWNNEKIERTESDNFYDTGSGETPGLGGTTTLVYDTRTGELEKHFLSLVGTIRNCAGGLLPGRHGLPARKPSKRRRKLTNRTTVTTLKCLSPLPSDLQRLSHSRRWDGSTTKPSP